MKISKKALFLFASSSFVLPLLLSYLPVNELPIEALILENDPKVEKPKLDWKLLLGDSVFFKDAQGKDTFELNNLSSREKMIGNHLDQIDQYSNQNFGFRPFYVRLRNQLDFGLFNKAHANSVIVGKEGYLYESTYIKSVYGQDFIGHDSINHRVEKLKYIQEQLQSQGKLVFVVIAPGKGSFYPEYIPDEYGGKIGTTNYEAYIKAFKNNSINYIDFNDYFIKKKRNSEHVLYPKTGIHWSQYGMYQALDSILGYIEAKKQIDLVDIYIDKNAKPGNELKFKDNDIEKGLNLFLGLEHLSMTYPKFNYLPGEGKTRPSMLTISDSFFWQMYDLGISHEVFTDGKFWFYNQTVHPDSEEKGYPVFANQMNLFEELQKRDVVMLMATEANLYKFGYGFIEEAESTLKSGLETYKKRIEEIKIQIQSTPEWYAQIQLKAKEKGVSVEEMLLTDAQYVYTMELQKK